jgi:hypothetical protein
VDSFWTIVKIFLGKCQVFDRRNRKKLRSGEKRRPHSRVIQPFIPVCFLSADWGDGPRGSSIARRVSNVSEITKGGLDDE